MKAPPPAFLFPLPRGRLRGPLSADLSGPGPDPPRLRGRRRGAGGAAPPLCYSERGIRCAAERYLFIHAWSESDGRRDEEGSLENGEERKERNESI